MGSGIGPGWGILGLSSGPLALKLVSRLDHGGSAGAGTRHAWSCSAGDFIVAMSDRKWAWPNISTALSMETLGTARLQK